jgi:hypothetical protein
MIVILGAFSTAKTQSLMRTAKAQRRQEKRTNAKEKQQLAETFRLGKRRYRSQHIFIGLSWRLCALAVPLGLLSVLAVYKTLSDINARLRR